MRHVPRCDGQRTPQRTPLRSGPSTLRRAGVVIAGLVAAGLLSTGCVATIEPEAGANTTSRPAPSGDGNTPADGAATASSAGPNSDAADTEADVMRMALVGGGEIDLAAYLDKPLLLWFWAPF